MKRGIAPLCIALMAALALPAGLLAATIKPSTQPLAQPALAPTTTLVWTYDTRVINGWIVQIDRRLLDTKKDHARSSDRTPCEHVALRERVEQGSSRQ
jgi:hypothetical protein